MIQALVTPAGRAGWHHQPPGGLWILMRLIEAWNRRPQDNLSSVSSPGTVTRLSGTARRRLPSVAAAGLWPVPWEPSLQWELKWELKSVSRTRSTPLFRVVRNLPMT